MSEQASENVRPGVWLIRPLVETNGRPVEMFNRLPEDLRKAVENFNNLPETLRSVSVTSNRPVENRRAVCDYLSLSARRTCAAWSDVARHRYYISRC
jgi:hypothetical protein